MNEEKTIAAPTAADRYAALEPDREHFVTRADEAAKLTLPMLFQKDVNAAKDMKINDPEQSVGTRGVNTMAAKLVVSLFPMYTPFYKFNIDEVSAKQELDEDAKLEISKALALLERQALREIENTGDTAVLNEAFKHLLVTGNVGAFVGPNSTRLYNLSKYVVVRDSEGDVREAVIKETVSPELLTAEFHAKLARSGKNITESKDNHKNQDLYTHIKFDKASGRVKWHQEVHGIKLETGGGDVPMDGNPWLFLRFSKIDSEDYGRSYVEMYLGDLKSLETLTKAVNDAAKAAAKVVILVNPNGTTTINTITDAENLSVLSGNADDVTILRLEKTADMSIAKSMIEEITRRLAHAFMMRSEVMRDAERVTAEEVRIVARELDESNGGIYSLLSKELQMPYVKRRIFLMRKRNKIAKLPEGVELAIVTGFSAIGRAGESERLTAFIAKVSPILADEALGTEFNRRALVEKIAIADGVDITGLLWTKDQKSQMSAEKQSATMNETVMPEVVKGMMPTIAGAVQPQEGNQDV